MARKPEASVVVAEDTAHRLNKRAVLVVLIIIVVLIGVGCLYYFVFRKPSGPTAADKQQQSALQKSLTVALQGAPDNQTVVTDTSQLINGAANGSFKIGSADLAQYYLQRATAYLSLKQYQNAVNDYDQAAKLDGDLKIASLQGEIEAKYNLGQRKQLIPMYQQLINLEGKSHDPFAGSLIGQYQAAITALQNNQELDF